MTKIAFHKQSLQNLARLCLLTWIFISVNLFSASAQLFESKLTLAKQYLSDHAKELGLSSNDLNEMTLSSETYFRFAELNNIYFQQNYKGIQVFNAILSVHIQGNTVMNITSTFIPKIESKIKSSLNPTINQGTALMNITKHLGYKMNSPVKMKRDMGGSSKEVWYDKGGLSQDDIPVRLNWVAGQDGSVRLAWEVIINEPGGKNWWVSRVDASTGTVLDKNNWVVSCNFGDAHHHAAPNDEYCFETTHQMHAAAPLMMAPNSQYRVFKQPIESPNHGGRTLVADPEDPTASPFGWHDTNGSPGPEFTVTRGNNVHAYTDVDANNSPDPGSDPDGGASLTFDFGLDLTMNPDTYRPAAVTNLFYWNNYIHDFAYRYGFDEVNGNFQVNNYGNGGLGNDDVRAEAQDGGGLNNANFGTPVDGLRPRMQMFLWNTSSPRRDGDFDNGVIAHEYAHGISNRLTGGPGNVNCLNNNEQMGEGWSDFYSLMTTWTGSVADRGIGTYVLNQSTSGVGIRPTKYSTDMTVNPSTYNTIKTSAIPHGVGYVWCSMLWEMVGGLVSAHGPIAGFDEAMKLVNLGMILQPCSPGFVDGRNAILKADSILFKKANYCIIWTAFAKRGLGYSAIQGSSNSTTDGTQAFDLPPMKPVLNCRNVTINLPSTAAVPILPQAPVPSMLAAQTKGVSGICPAPAIAINQCDCPTGAVAVGYTVVYGNGYGVVVSRFKLNCRYVNPDGSLGAVAASTCENGLAIGTTTATETAPNNEVLVGFQNRMGCAVDNIKGRSKTVASILANSSNASNTTLAGIGGAVGGLQPLQLAPDGNVIIGMQNYIDASNNICAGYAWKYAKLSDVMKGITTAYNCAGGAVTVTLSKSSFNCSDLGVSTVTATATDGSGNTSTCSFSVTVNAVPCKVPIQVYHTDTTETQGTVKWKANGICISSYELRIRSQISPGVWSAWSGWTSPSGPGLAHTFVGLTPNTFYQYQIHSKCGPGSNSPDVNDWFYTLPGGAPLRDANASSIREYFSPEGLEISFSTSAHLSPNIYLAPNPADNYINISLEGFESYSKNLSIINMLGKQVYTTKLEAVDNDIVLNFGEIQINNGMYFIRVADGLKQKTVQLVIGRN